MECKDLLLDGFSRVREFMHLCLTGLDSAQICSRPAPHANSIAWLAWHLTRIQDDHVSGLADRPQMWIAGGWHARFGKPADPGDTGFGYSPEQVGGIRPASAQLLLDYYDAVHEQSLAYLRTVTPAELDRELDEPQWDTPVTAGVRLVSVIADCLQHSGQMDYLRGLVEDKVWYPV
jgi:hypothetical protein